MSSIVFLTIEQALEIHSRTLEAHGGAPGLRSRALLESAVFQPQQSAFGEDAYPTLPEKGVAYAIGIIKNHRSLTATSGRGSPVWPRSCS
jgi:death-on-curing protein